MTIDPGIKLLIVDDLPENLLALEASIRDDGYSIHEASSGEEALALLLEHEFALAILDVQMPGMNGFELKRELSTRYDSLPVIMITARAEPGVEEKAMSSGATCFLRKPFGAETLMNCLQRVLKSV